MSLFYATVSATSGNTIVEPDAAVDCAWATPVVAAKVVKTRRRAMRI